ncbi:hypothetical protein [Bacillus sp. FJAT-49736]|uniref:hypothetical protein n=1 Tax=Bacillus sp. FJAT-49736 TaxID=2833582 RepID=UPI001BC98D9C|nr:hypothetical protein [Bacillus sp. FJAT-49736]MBS4174487.1 hypothetical protein [Bacillus sp. FJAT-49736]
MASYITLGRFTLSADMVSAFASLLLSAFLFKYMKKERIGDWYWNSFFLYLIVYKFSYMITNFHLFMNNPMSLLYFNGGTWGQVLAVVSVAIYLYGVHRKRPIHIESFSSYLLFFIIYQLILHFCVQNFYAAIFELIILATFLFLFFKKRITYQQMIIFNLVEALLLSIFNELSGIKNLSFVCLGLFLFIIGIRRDENP